MWQKIINWSLKNWLLLVNYIVIFVSYSNVYGHEELVGTETLLGLWIFVSAAYVLYKLFIKK